MNSISTHQQSALFTELSPEEEQFISGGGWWTDLKHYASSTAKKIDSKLPAIGRDAAAGGAVGGLLGIPILGAIAGGLVGLFS